MTTAIVAPTVSGAPHSDSIVRPGPVGAVRHLDHHQAQHAQLTRIPEALFFSTVQPIMFVLLFRYVFGGAIHTPGSTTSTT